MKPLFVFCADLHLEDGAWSSRPGIYGDAYWSFEQIVDYCIAAHLPLILGGDVLEKKSNSARPIAKLCAGLSKLQAANVPAYYIQGNHEFDRNAPWLSVHPWPIHMHEASFDINGAKVCGFDWLPRGEIQEAFTRVPEDVDIMVTHQVWEDFMKGLGRIDCELKNVYHAQTVLNGDFHVTKTVTGVNFQGKTVTMLSPGSICMQDMSEAPDKFFFVICRMPDGTFHFEPQQLMTRRFANYVVKDQETLDKLCAGQLRKDILTMADANLPTYINKPLIRIKFDKQLPDAYLRLMTAVGDFAHIACEAISEKYNTAKTAAPRAGAKNSLLSAVGDLLGDVTDAYKLATALLRAEDPMKEFDIQVAKYLNGEFADATVATGSEELGASQVPPV